MVVQGNPDDRTALWDWLARWLVRVALLFVLGYLASLIAARGANFYLAARTTPKE
jgi:ABC-type phosphate transport system auxiliary subunit